MASIHGVFAVYKPSGLLSSAILASVRRALRDKAAALVFDAPPKKVPLSPCGESQDAHHRLAHARRVPLRVGHGGTLDPLAQGVMVVGVGRGCKQLPLLLHGFKARCCASPRHDAKRLTLPMCVLV